ncbi:putative transcription factor C2H2 family [Lupinus albus]|uniref:RING-type E3 ubiquitin transferase n=1 Tax=Lupinus albus TaxID=3870 RepID=A0A6A4NSE3_LUPAL|nr:putative transcription factor C2H2 family [Lupinus albus]
MQILIFLQSFSLAEYTKENPKIMTKCSHHFHLGCIYEWMERSDNCSVCGKVILFTILFLIKLGEMIFSS